MFILKRMHLQLPSKKMTEESKKQSKHHYLKSFLQLPTTLNSNNMKNSVLIFLAFGLAISCRKKIDIDLNESTPKLVLEANYNANDSTVSVRITKTSSYFDDNSSPVINNATVTITNQAGISSNVSFLNDGTYELTEYAPEWNTTYKMNIVVDGTNYESSCFLHDTISLIRPMKTEFTPGFFGGDDGESAYVEYQDPAGTTEDATIAVLSINDERFGTFQEMMTNDDELTNGNLFSRPFFGKIGQSGDSVTIELLTVDIKILRYVDQTKSLSNPNNAAPANPDYLWTNDALGYFSTYGKSVNWKSIP